MGIFFGVFEPKSPCFGFRACTNDFRPVSLLFARALKFRFALSGTSGIIRFRARVAEWQTRRSQKPLSKDVRVRLSPRAPF